MKLSPTASQCHDSYPRAASPSESPGRPSAHDAATRQAAAAAVNPYPTKHIALPAPEAGSSLLQRGCDMPAAAPSAEIAAPPRVAWSRRVVAFTDPQNDLLLVEDGLECSWGRLSNLCGYEMQHESSSSCGDYKKVSYAGGINLERRDGVLFLSSDQGGSATLRAASAEQTRHILVNLRVEPLPAARRPEYLARLAASPNWEEGTYLYVDAPKYKFSYEFHAYIVREGARPQTLAVENVQRAKDGGTTFIKTPLGLFHFPSMLCGREPACFTSTAGVKAPIGELSVRDHAALIASFEIDTGDDALALPPLPEVEPAKREAFAATHMMSGRDVNDYFFGAADPRYPIQKVEVRACPEGQELFIKDLSGTFYLLSEGALYARYKSESATARNPVAVAGPTARALFEALQTVKPGDPASKVRDIFRDITGR